jgi:hypothetical protein
MSDSVCLRRFKLRARRPYSRLIAGLASIMMLAAAAPDRVRAQVQVFTPNNLVVSRSVYAGTSSTVTVGETLPPNCVPGTVTLPILGSTKTTSVKVTCATATTDGAYPFVFNNALADGSFGVTSPIFLDQITTGGTLLNTFPIDDTQIDTSFSSKSELALNKSSDGLSLTFVGYVGGPGFTTGPNVLDVSNSNTPGVVDPTNPVPSQYYRSVAEVDAFDNLQITDGNAYSGDNGRAAIKGANGFYYTAGNDNNGGLSKTQLPETQVGVNLITSTGAELLVPDQTPPLPPNIDMIGELSFDSDKPGKDTNFRGLAIFDNTLYVSKGSGSNGVNTVYQVGAQGTLPTPAINGGNLTVPITILPGFNTTYPTFGGTAAFPFGIWFANANTLYVADEGNGNIGTTSTSNAYADALPENNPSAGLQKWIFNGTTWTLAYTLTAGLGLGVPYAVADYPTGNNSANTTSLFPSGLPWAPAPDGLRNITGRVNTDGTVNIWAITSTVSGSGDQGADPNQLVFITDELASTTPPAGAQFAVLETAQSGEVLRGVSFAPGAIAAAPSTPMACNGVYNGTFHGNLTVSAGQNCVFVGGAIDGNVTLNGGNLQLTNVTVSGNVQIQQGDATFSLGPSATIDGNLQIQNIPSGTAQNQVCDTQILGNLQYQNDGTAVQIGSASPTCTGNTIGGNLQVQNNTADTTIDDNTVKGNLQVNGDSGTTDVSANAVGGNLQCQNNNPSPTSTYGSNTVKGNAQGQCAPPQ